MWPIAFVAAAAAGYVPRAPASGVVGRLAPRHREHAPPAALRCGPQRQRPCMYMREMTRIEDEEAYDAMIESATAENRVIVIKFFASWCRACKAMAPKIDKVADQWPDIEFYDLMFDNNKKLCKKLGIKVLPYVEIVSGRNGKVEAFSCGPSKIQLLEDKLTTHAIAGR